MLTGILPQELERLSQNDQQNIAHVWALFSAAPAKHRELMLRGVLAQCCFPQLSLLSNSVQRLIRIDFLTALPTELAYRVLCFLDTASLCKAAQVSQRWRALADDDVVWHRMCEQHIDRRCTKCGWGLPLLERKRLQATKRQIQLKATGQEADARTASASPAASDGISEENVDSAPTHPAPEAIHDSTDVVLFPTASGTTTPVPRVRPWKDVYRDRFRVGVNWKHGRFRARVFRGHSNGVTCLQFDEHVLATGSWDATVRLWDLATGAPLRTLRGHTGGLRCLQFDATKLISGGLDRSLRVWDRRTGACARVLNGHADGALALHFVGARLASGSKDRTVRVWDFDEGSSFVLKGHTDWVNSVRLDAPSRTLLSASDDLTVRLWDLEARATTRVFRGHVGHVQQVVPLPPEFELEEQECDDEEEAPAQPLPEGATDTPPLTDPDAAAVASGPATPPIPYPPSEAVPPADGAGDAAPRAHPPRYMLTSGLDNHIRLWDVASGRCLRTLFGHVEGVWALAADTLRAVSGAQDCMVKVWDARSGRCERTLAGHTGPVACIGLSDSRIVSGSEDCEVRMWCFKDDAEDEEDGGN